MPFAEELAELAKSNASRNAGAWYGAATGLAPGVGIIFTGVPHPLFNPAERRFQVVVGPVLVLTHECDIDPSNERSAMNSTFLVAPLIQMSAFAQAFASEGLEEVARDLALNIAANRVHRMMYLPPPNELLRIAEFPLGAFIFFNSITHADVRHLTDGVARPVCALSELGLDVLDRRLQNHLFRPKAERLPRTR